MIKVKSKIHTYEVDFYSIETLNQLIPKYDLVIVDGKVEEFWDLTDKSQAKIIFNSHESRKNLQNVSEVIEMFASNSINRNSRILSIGGGVLQDITTLACSLYMRGIRWDFVPTTLQAIGDSCIGGKSAINSKVRKNLIGNYFPPNQIFICLDFLRTLSKIDLECGIFEIIKINMVDPNPENFAELIKLKDILLGLDEEYNFDFLKKIVATTLDLKAKIVEEDEFDHGIRRLLNFGHTFGHAFEALSDFKIPHGHGVALGMLSAIELSKSLPNYEPALQYEFLHQLIIDILAFSDSESYSEFVRSIEKISYVELLLGDKKSEKNAVNFILPSKFGLVLKNFVVDSDFLQRIHNTLDKVASSIGDKR